MNWNNWIYLAVGLLIGAGFRSLFTNKKSRSIVSEKSHQDEVSELRNQIKHLYLAYSLATEMSQFKAGFLARTTHVLRSPLNGLIGLHQLILSDLCESPEEERQFIADAHERALKLLKLIDEILNVARAERSNNCLNMQPQSLNELLQEVHDLIYMLAENRNYPFKISLPDSEIYVLTDIKWLRQVLIILIETVIAQMEIQMEEGSIYVSVSGADTNKYTYIWLDVPTYAFPSSEIVNLMDIEAQQNLKELEDKAISPGMKLLLATTILEVLGGKLEVVPYPDNTQSQATTRLQISIHLATLETAPMIAAS
ncbi:two-component sensor histidine kinase [Rivularia sp. IAM M-261]|nr:two-component sensor histidine kinase [Calothrix sp. PCC 7716]GJD16928.1 two-component sensor histidine kinase [Rivularia sp. IAM M-261]